MRGISRLALALNLLGGGLLQAAPIYTAVPLGTFGGAVSGARGINASGHVVGYAATASGQNHAFVYTGGSLIDLGTLGGGNSYAHGINASGQITGYAEVPSGNLHAFLYSGGMMVDIGTLGGATSSGEGINDLGQIAGWSRLASGFDHAFLYSGGVMIDLGTTGGSRSYGSGINNAGQITGQSEDASGRSRPFLYSGGTMSNLGDPANPHLGLGQGINDSGQIVGISYIGPQGAFLYTAGSFVLLGPPTPGLASAYGINASGQVVGYSNVLDPSRNDRAFLYADGAFLDLTALVANGMVPGVYLVNATDINDNGWIAANGSDGRAYLLIPQTPVPEPASVALTGLGLTALLIARRRWSC